MNHHGPGRGGSARGRRGAPRRRDASLDGLRGIAALAVVFSHVAAMTWVPFEDHGPAPHVWSYVLWHLGAPAVDLFFVLSGYVVARSIIERPSGYLPYVLGRFTRLLPTAWAGVLAGLALRVMIDSFPDGMSRIVGHMLEPLAGTDVMGLATMIWPVADVDKVDGQLWSMFVETQASMLLPLAVLGARRSIVLYAVAVSAAGAVAIAATGNLYPLYFTGFALGVAYAVRRDDVPVPPTPALALAGGLAILLVRHWTGSDDQMYRVVGACGALVVIIAVRAGAGRAFLQGQLCQWLGLVSYPLYAIHVPLMIGSCAFLSGRLGITTAAISSIPVSLVAAHLVAVAIDRPATRLSRLVRA